MIPALKAEFRKLWTVRSTYILFGIAFAITGLLVGLWAYGYKDAGHAATERGALADYLLATVSVTGIFLSFIAILLVGHEYRHNTIMYSLTSTNRRYKLFFAKWAMLLAFSVVFTAVIMLLGLGLFRLGQAWHGVHAVAQQVPVWNLLWRSVVTIWGDITYAFIITMLVRNLIGAIAIVLVLPTTVENLLILLLHDNTKYLPYTALGNLTDTVSKTSVTTSLLIVCGYVAGGLLITYTLFQKRDAN